MIRSAVGLSLWCLTAAVPGVASADWDAVEAILQRQGEKIGSSIRFSYSRIERRANKGRGPETCPSSMASDITLRMVGKSLAELEGVIVALPGEMPVVERKLQAEGLLVTKVDLGSGSKKAGIKVHFSGRGNPAALVWAFSPALSATDTPMGPPLFPPGYRCSGPAR